MNNGQRITGAAEAPLGWQSGDPTQLAYASCYRSADTGATVTPFAGTFVSVVEVSTTRTPFAASETVSPASGTYDVGFCVSTQFTSNSSVALDDNDFVNGWVMVTNN